MSLDIAHDRLGWPARNEILKPSGEGARVYAQLAQAKLGNALARQPDSTGLQVGILASDSSTHSTEPPLAVVCEFPQRVSEQTLRDAQRLAWNFSRSPMLVTAEPHLLRAWTCCEPPSEDLFGGSAVHELSTDTLASREGANAGAGAVLALHWVNLVSGYFFKENEKRFRRDQRADQTLLDNLRFVRTRLRDTGLHSDDVCHDLLARIMFIQFLFDRKDSSGNAALNPGKLEWLKDQSVLKAKHENFSSILGDYEETYRFFRWLNRRFNGDLFPGKGKTERERGQAWQAEKRQVKPKHLEILEQFVSGQLDMPRGQRCLWRQYAFDAIPLEFISSIYEAFVGERARAGGIYYTPPHLVDFMLDRVLPWSGLEWDLKILDPACGSGVFLVKAFQRLIHRWKNAHPNEDVRSDILRRLLERNLFGVDKDPHAVRVASFSLYLAMCDEIDPRYYWTQVKFPPMRGKRLITADFFNESRTGFNTRRNAASFDRVVGNAPWGGDPVTGHARRWASRHNWPIAERDIGTLFLPKAAALTKRTGKVCMLQPARVLLFNQRGPAREFRKKLFGTFGVEEVVNFSALRFTLFEQADDPVCAVTLSPEGPTALRIGYICPKPAHASDDDYQFTIESPDVHQIHQEDAANDPYVWSAFVWGGQRDLVFIRWLRHLMSLESLKKSGVAKIRRGISRGDRQKRQSQIGGKHILEADGFPSGTLLKVKAKEFPINDDLQTHSKDSTDFSAFALPQLILKQSWQKERFRFQAAVVESDAKTGPLLCSRSYASVHMPEGKRMLLDAACAALNSKLAVYYLLLASGRFASYREEPNLADLLKVPIPDPRPDFLKGISDLPSLDIRVRNAFGFKDAEWVLVEDLCDITLADFKGPVDSPGRRPTQRIAKQNVEPQLRQYCEYLIRALRATFGQDKIVSATIFQEKTSPWLPFRLVAFRLNCPASASTSPELLTLEPGALLEELQQLNQNWLQSRQAKTDTIFHQRIARIYNYRDNSPTIYIIKPDACRHWTRSMGLHDADEVAADFVRWQMASLGTEMEKENAFG